MKVQLYIDPACQLSKVPYLVPNNIHYVTYQDFLDAQNQPDALTAYLYAAELAKDDIKKLKAEVERLTNQNALATPRHLIASQDIKTLREQIEELKLENSQYEEHHKYGQNVITSLREEVERLTKLLNEPKA